ncbi:MAG TPA: NAD(P)-dependent oxidoreductase [Chloroflexota bacterium]|nr:NAD(P)-dependent oxidoreductase [Chloroflexota bacterium]
MPKRKVLLTGATGYVASQMLPTLRERYDLTLCDIRPTDRQGNPVEGVQVADLTNPDLDANRALFKGVDTVVHLAFVSRQGVAPEDSYLSERTNVDMAYNVYRLVQQEGGRRVVMASSNHAADFYEYPIWRRELDRITPHWPRPLSDNFYGWAKEAYEHLGFVFASGGVGRPVEVVQIRIGAPRPIKAETFFNAERDDPVAYTRDLGAYVSPRDLTQLFVKSIEAEDIRDEWGVPWQVFYGISGNTRAFWSNVAARKVVGYEPEDDSEILYRDDIHKHLTRSPFAGPLIAGKNRRGGF